MTLTYLLVPHGQVPPEQPRGGLRGKRVVIVEDEGVTQLQLQKVLTRAGLMIVGSAADGKEGVEVVLRELPDLVLMDIRMPVMDGIEAARQILATVKICVVMLTAFSDEEYRERAKEIDACGYILKPVTGAMLLPFLEAAYRGFQSS